MKENLNRIWISTVFCFVVTPVVVGTAITLISVNWLMKQARSTDEMPHRRLQQSGRPRTKSNVVLFPRVRRLIQRKANTTDD